MYIHTIFHLYCTKTSLSRRPQAFEGEGLVSKSKVKVSFVALFGIITVIHTNSTDRKRKITVEHSDKLGALLIQSRAGPQQITCHFRFTMINT